MDKALLSILYDPAPASGRVVLLECLSSLGSGWALLALLLPLTFRSLRALRRDAFTLLVTVLATSAMVAWLKAMMHRPRPFVAFPDVRALGSVVPTDYGFPSGHAAGSFVVVGYLAIRAPKLAFPALVCATLVALSRVALGVHYPTDVVAGALFGAVVGLGAACLLAQFSARTKRPNEPASRAPALE